MPVRVGAGVVWSGVGTLASPSVGITLSPRFWAELLAQLGATGIIIRAAITFALTCAVRYVPGIRSTGVPYLIIVE